MKYEGISFNVTPILNMTLEELLQHKGYQNCWPLLDMDKRKARLKELFEFIQLSEHQ